MDKMALEQSGIGIRFLARRWPVWRSKLMTKWLRRWFLLFILAGSWLVPTPMVLADGCYIPAKAIKKLPSIPSQRAIVAWQEGTETLVISSTLDSAAQRLGWIVPVPNAPTEMKKVSPGAFKTLSFCLQPHVTHDLSRDVFAVALAAVIGVALLGTMLLNSERLASVVLLTLVVLFFLGMLMPAYSGSTAGASSVQVDRTARVGAYDISVLRVQQPADLNAWLSGNGFAELPQSALPVVKDYAQANWVFVAMKLARQEGGVSAPHPIKLVFPSPEIVYPLKLTGLPGGSTFFELFVVADTRVANSRLQAEFCDTFQPSQEEDHNKEEDAAGELPLRQTYIAADSHLEVGHPELLKLLWPGCVVTKLSGEIAAAEMGSDLVFASMKTTPERQWFFTNEGARSLAAIVFILLLALFCVVTFVIWRKRLSDVAHRLRYYRETLLPAAVVILLLSVGVFFCLPRLGADETHVTRGWGHGYYAQRALYYSIQSYLASEEGLLEKSEDEIAQTILSGISESEDIRLHHGETNQVAGGLLGIEDSPGNFTVEKDGRRLVVRIYDYWGRPEVLEYPSPEDVDGS